MQCADLNIVILCMQQRLSGMSRKVLIICLALCALLSFTGYKNFVDADDASNLETPTAEQDIGKYSEGSRTDDESVSR